MGFASNFVLRISRWVYEEEDRIKSSGETSLQYIILDISSKYEAAAVSN